MRAMARPSAGWNPCAASKCGDTDVLLPQPFPPAAFLVQATDGHRQLRTKPSDELDDEPLGSAGVEAQDHLKHVGWLAGRCRHGYSYGSAD